VPVLPGQSAASREITPSRQCKLQTFRAKEVSHAVHHFANAWSTAPRRDFDCDIQPLVRSGRVNVGEPDQLDSEIGELSESKTSPIVNDFAADEWVGRMQRVSTNSIKNTRKEVNDMPLLQVVIVLIVVGVLLWLVNRYIPMQSTIKSILNAVVVIAVVLWLLNLFGLFQAFSNIHVGK
jgi:hypothetical protein